MTVESLTLNVDERFLSKEPRLPQGIRKHIRKLKEDGRLEEALRFARSQRDKKTRSLNAVGRLKEDVAIILESDDLKQEAVAVIEATWALSRLGDLKPGERSADIMATLDNYSDIADALELELPKLRDEMQNIALS